MKDFPGGVFDDALSDGRSAATLTPKFDRVEARLEGGRTYVIVYDHLRMEFGGATGRMLFLRGPEPRLTLFSEAPGLLEAIQAEGGLAAAAAVGGAVEGRTRTRRNGWRNWGIALAALAVLAVGVPPLFRVAVDAAVQQLPLSVDTKLGELASSEIGRLGPAITDERAAGLATEIVDRLEAHLPPEIQALDLKVTVIESTQVNAFALPGGRMAVLSGLVKKADSVDMIAGVLAHELMHVQHRHGLRHIVRAAGIVTALTVLFGDATGLVGMVAEGAALAALTSYSREQEAEADADGLRLTAAAGFDPAGLPAFFKKLKEVSPDSEAPEGLEWVASHPRHDERIATLEALLPGLKRGDAPPMKHTLDAARAALKGE